jgi:hypothetical protein
LTGRIDIEIEISNQCARLIANAIIYYNSAILSHLLTKYEGSGNVKAVGLIIQLCRQLGGTFCLTGTTLSRATAS